MDIIDALDFFSLSKEGYFETNYEGKGTLCSRGIFQGNSVQS